ncbi:MAG: response regulator [Myxococcales bacterium]|nr:response regulator [Myxococcales bacterium]
MQKATSGIEALEALKESGVQIDVVLTDVNMPGVSGIDVAQEVASTWSSIAVLLVSGREAGHEVLMGLPPSFGLLQQASPLQ